MHYLLIFSVTILERTTSAVPHVTLVTSCDLTRHPRSSAVICFTGLLVLFPILFITDGGFWVDSLSASPRENKQCCPVAVKRGGGVQDRVVSHNF